MNEFPFNVTVKILTKFNPQKKIDSVKYLWHIFKEQSVKSVLGQKEENLMKQSLSI